MGEYKTPGVYIKEKNTFGNSVVVAETAIPVFIGLTEKHRMERNPYRTNLSGFHRCWNMNCISEDRRYTALT